jgi:hypothetical protein
METDAARSAGATDASLSSEPDSATDAEAGEPFPEPLPDAGAAMMSTCTPTSESCDGTDNDCDGQVDEGVKKRCWADADGDGYAAAGAASIESCQCDGKQTAQEPIAGKVDCDDANATKNPSATDVCGDHIDNDCDGMPDDEMNNACGGPCSTQLTGLVGESCSNGQGACKQSGLYECQPDHSLICKTPIVQPAPVDTCGDNIDNDCDGQTDEDGKSWYPDCDADGFPGKGAATVSCTKPASITGCVSWIAGPVDKWDCDDGNARRYPGASYDLGIPAPVTNANGGVWTLMTQPFPDAKLFDGDMNCDGIAEQAQTMIERKIDGGDQYIRHVTYAPCTVQIECATGATSDSDVCYTYTLATPGSRCGTVSIYVASKDDFTGVCHHTQEDVSIVCK